MTVYVPALRLVCAAPVVSVIVVAPADEVQLYTYGSVPFSAVVAPIDPVDSPKMATFCISVEGMIASVAMASKYTYRVTKKTVNNHETTPFFYKSIYNYLSSMLDDPCEQYVDRESCDQPGCQWTHSSTEEDGKCVMRPDTFLQSVERVPFDFVEAEALSLPIMQALGDIVRAIVPGLQGENIVDTLERSRIVNIEWLERAVERQMNLNQSNDWSVILDGVLNDVTNEICSLCHEGHARLDGVVATRCCKMLMHNRCHRVCRGCPVCPPETEVAVNNNNNNVNEALLALQPRHLKAFFGAVLGVCASILITKTRTLAGPCPFPDSLMYKIFDLSVTLIEPLGVLCLCLEVVVILRMLTAHRAPYYAAGDDRIRARVYREVMRRQQIQH